MAASCNAFDLYCQRTIFVESEFSGGDVGGWAVGRLIEKIRLLYRCSTFLTRYDSGYSSSIQARICGT